MIHDYLTEPQRQEAVTWLRAHGFVENCGLLAIAWPTRDGYDFTDLEFYPLARRALDAGWDAIIGHHASGENPRMVFGTCENLEDIKLAYETVRRLNGTAQEPTP